jgi:hypothetical protein
VSRRALRVSRTTLFGTVTRSRVQVGNSRGSVVRAAVISSRGSSQGSSGVGVMQANDSPASCDSFATRLHEFFLMTTGTETTLRREFSSFDRQFSSCKLSLHLRMSCNYRALLQANYAWNKASEKKKPATEVQTPAGSKSGKQVVRTRRLDDSA